jgi:hypothetical protein
VINATMKEPLVLLLLFSPPNKGEIQIRTRSNLLANTEQIQLTHLCSLREGIKRRLEIIFGLECDERDMAQAGFS